MDKRQIVAVVGGACAGSEAAHQLASRGIRVVVFEQNALPYGKIEDGLPRWHSKLQDREIKKIDEKISQPLVDYVPHCKLGTKITLQELLDLKFSAIILANGAWKDRPLKAIGIEKITDKSFCYQNPFIYWFNHYHEKNYTGEHFAVRDGAVIVGGGLASIDVAKVCQLEMVKQKLQQRGVEVDVIAMEHKGIPKYLDSLDLCFEDLEIKPACIYYRRRDIDMPLAEVPYGCSEEKLRKVQNVRKKIIANAHKKYLFDVRPLCLTKEVHSQAGSVCGITFHCMNYDGRELTKSTQEIYVDTKLVISSIGSIPEPLNDIPMERETYAISDTITGAVNNYHGVYGVGNAVTGKGNIMVSNRHARSMSSFVASAITRTPREEMVNVWENQNQQVQTKMQEIYEYLLGMDGLQEEELQTIDDKISDLQQQVNYRDYMDWKEKILAGRS